MPSFLKFFHSLGRETNIPASTRLVALIIGGHCKPVSGDGAYPAIRTIAKKSGLSRSTVDRSIDWLEANGWLEVTPATGYGKGWRRNRYRLRLPDKVSQRVGHEAAGTPYRDKDNNLKNNSGAQKRETETPKTAWQKVIEAMQRFGSSPGNTDPRRAFLGERINKALDAIGGFVPQVCRAAERDLHPGGPVSQRFVAAWLGAGA